MTISVREICKKLVFQIFSTIKLYARF